MKPETPAQVALARLRALQTPEVLADRGTGDDKTAETCRAFFDNPIPFMRAPGQGLRAACLAAVLLGLTACAPGAQPGVGKAQVAAAEITLTEAERLVKLYTDLPLCPAPAPCSTPGLRMTLIADSHAAYAAFKQFQAAPSEVTMAAAQLAVRLLTNETPPAPVKP